MLRSSGIRFLIVGLLILLMFIPLLFVSETIDSRSRYSRDTIRDVGQEWGGAQTLSGPMLIVPVSRVETRIEPDPVRDGETVTRQVTVTGDPLFIQPEAFRAQVDLATNIRKRGFFEVPVYAATLVLDVDYNLSARSFVVGERETILWDQARIEFGVTSNRALRGDATLSQGDRTFPLSSRAGKIAGFQAPVGDIRGDDALRLTLGLNGASQFLVSPMGRTSEVTIAGDWPHPAFTGGFLPDDYDITDTAFSARWTIPHLASALPRQSRQSDEHRARSNAFGVEFAQPNDFYQKSYRAARYGIMFIALTFLTVLLMDRQGARPTHPLQYLLIGLAQSVFFLLLVAFAEQLGFAAAYAIAGTATVSLLTLYGLVGLGMGKRASVLGAMLLALYGALYLILRSADFALLIGSLLAFAALAATMFVTRNEDWYGRITPPSPKAAAPGAGAGTPAPDTSANAPKDP